MKRRRRHAEVRTVGLQLLLQVRGIGGEMTRMSILLAACVATSLQLAGCDSQEKGPPCPRLISEYSDASVQRRLCLEGDGVVLYTWGRGVDEPVRQVLNAPSIQ